MDIERNIESTACMSLHHENGLTNIGGVLLGLCGNSIDSFMQLNGVVKNKKIRFMEER